MQGDILSDRLDDLITENKKSLNDISKKTGICKSTLSKYQNGEFSKCGIGSKNLIALSRYFNVSTDYLLGLTDVRSNDSEVRFISEYLGLNESIIAGLHADSQKSQLIRWTFNILFMAKNTDFFEAFERYMLSRYSSVLDSNKAKIVINSMNSKKQINKNMMEESSIKKIPVAISAPSKSVFEEILLEKDFVEYYYLKLIEKALIKIKKTVETHQSLLEFYNKLYPDE